MAASSAVDPRRALVPFDFVTILLLWNAPVLPTIGEADP